MNWKTVKQSELQLAFLAFIMLADSGRAAVTTGSATFVDQGTTSTSLIAPAITTSTSNELLLAFVSADNVSTAATTVTAMSGGGLVWTKVVATNAQRGTAEVWRAFAAVPTANIAVNATLSQSVTASMSVISFRGVDTTGTNGSGAIGAFASSSAASGAPSASLVTTRSGSWVFGVGNDWDSPIGRTVGPGQTLLHQYFPPVGDTYWVQSQTSPTPLAGTTVFINDTAPTSDRYDLSIVEILPGGPVVPTYTLSGTISPALAGVTLTLSGTSSGTATSDVSGNYSFPGLINGTYTITPSKTGYAFSPVSQQVTVAGANATAAAFAATQTAFTLSGSITPAISGVTLTLSGSGSGTASSDGFGNYSFSGLSNGTYTVTPSKSGYTFAPVSQQTTISGANTSLGAFTATSTVVPGLVSVDVTTSTDRSTTASTIASPAFSTSSGNQLLLAFVGADFASKSNTQVNSVSGGGLTWVLVVRTNVQNGTAEVWRAFAAAPLTNATVTANLSNSVSASITVVSFTGVDTTGTNGSGAIGATGTGNALTGAPSATLTPTRDGSLLFGTGVDWDNPTPRTLGSGQAMVHEFLSVSADIAYWVQRSSASPPAGIATSLSDTAPTNERWDFSIVEVRPPSSVVPPTVFQISGTVTPTSSASGTVLTLSGAGSGSTTANTSGTYTFSGLPNGTYTVSPSKVGFTFTPTSRTVTIANANIGSVNFSMTTSSTFNLTVDGGTKFQTVDGTGVNINVNSWQNGQLIPALDALIDVNGSSLFRVIRDPMTWVSSESLIPALHNLDPVVLQQTYETPAMKDMWSTIAYLNQKGIGGNQIVLNFMGWTPVWLGGSGAFGSASNITAGKEQSLATMLASLIYYGRAVRGLQFNYYSPLNEIDWDCREGPCVGTAQYKTIWQALSAELDFMGQTGVRLVAPETAADPSAYIQSISTAGAAFTRTDHLTFHGYGSTRGPGTAYAQKNYWVTETSDNCGGCDTGNAPTGGEWNFAANTTDLVLDDLAIGNGAVMVYDGYDSFYYHHNSYAASGLLSYDQATGLYAPRKRFYTNAQVNRFVSPGSQRILANDTISGLDHVVAFYNSTTNRFTLIAHNTGAAPITINGLLTGLPVAVTSLSLYQTNSAVDLQLGAPITVTNGAFSVTIPAATIFSLTN